MKKIFFLFAFSLVSMAVFSQSNNDKTFYDALISVNKFQDNNNSQDKDDTRIIVDPNCGRSSNPENSPVEIKKTKAPLNVFFLIKKILNMDKSYIDKKKTSTAKTKTC